MSAVERILRAVSLQAGLLPIEFLADLDLLGHPFVAQPGVTLALSQLQILLRCVDIHSHERKPRDRAPVKNEHARKVPSGQDPRRGFGSVPEKRSDPLKLGSVCQTAAYSQS